MLGEARLVPGVPRIAYEQAGRGPTVIMLHGIGGNRSNWRGQLAVLASEFRALAWDARGYGDSDDYDGDLDFRDFSRDLLRLIDHVECDRAHLVGLSMGGRIALDFYECYPERVASLVLCDSFPGWDESFTAEARDEFVRIRKEPLLAGAKPKDMAPAVAKTLVSPTAAPEVVDQLIASMASLRTDSYIKAIEAMTHYQPVADLPRVEVPTQVIVGADDKLTPPETSQQMAAEIPGARLEVLMDAGHLSNLERPEAFNSTLVSFLRETAAKSSDS